MTTRQICTLIGGMLLIFVVQAGFWSLTGHWRSHFLIGSVGFGVALIWILVSQRRER